MCCFTFRFIIITIIIIVLFSCTVYFDLDLHILVTRVRKRWHQNKNNNELLLLVFLLQHIKICLFFFFLLSCSYPLCNWILVCLCFFSIKWLDSCWNNLTQMEKLAMRLLQVINKKQNSNKLSPWCNTDTSEGLKKKRIKVISR